MRTAPSGALRARIPAATGRRGKLLGTALVALAALFPGEARPVGGVGGGAAGGAGGADSLSGAGGAGATGSSTVPTGGSGGGAGVTGGAGGSVVGGGAGGAGGAIPGQSGAAGVRNAAGSGGGGGGAHGFVGAGLPSGSVVGGSGGQGGSASTVRGGGGGAGGFGAVITGDGALGRLTFNIRGGNGGVGGLANTGVEADTGGGGSGGIGLYLSGVAPSLTLGANVTGGSGGNRRPGSGGDAIVSTSGLTLVIEAGVQVTGGLAGSGTPVAARGHGIVGSGMQITNAGTILGMDALRFEGGANSLTLMAGSSITGNINLRNASTLTITPEASGSTLSAPVIGDGTLIKAGPGTLTLTGALSYTGETRVEGGTLALTQTDLLTSGASAFRIAAGATLDLTGVAGSGALSMGALNGAGDLAMSGTPRPLNLVGDSSFAGVISGSASLVITNGATVSLSGVNTYTGPTIVEQNATLRVNGSIASSSQLNVASGMVGGTGTLPGTTFLAQGRLSPGNSIGTITVQGNLAMQAGSALVMEVQGAAADRVNVSGAASLAGEIRLVPLGGSYQFGAPYTLLQAASVTGSPSLTTQGSFGAGVTATLSLNPTTVQLVLTPAILVPSSTAPEAAAALPATPPVVPPVVPLGAAPPPSPEPAAGPAPEPPAAPVVIIAPGAGLAGLLPGNLRATAAALDRANRAGADLSPFFNVYNQPAETLGLAVNQLSGEVATGTATMGFTSGTQFLTTLLDPMGLGQGSMLGGRLRPGGDGGGDDDGSLPHARRSAVWGSATGAYSRMSGNAAEGSASRTSRTAGFALGFDQLIGARSMAGVAIAVGESGTSLAGGQGSSTASFGQIGAYGTTRLGSFTFAGAGALTFLEVDTKRTLYFLNGDQQRAGFGALVSSLRAEMRQDGVALGGAFRLQPIAALQWQQVNNQAYTESSATTGRAHGVTVGAQSQASLRSELGAQLDGALQLGAAPARAFLRASWAHYLTRDAAMAVGFAALPNAAFTVQGGRPDANAALLSAGLEVPVAPGLTLAARLDSEFSAHVTQVAGTARLSYRF